MVERCDAAKPEFARWTLVQKDGRAPTPTELKEYAENRSLRSRGGTAPQLVDQLDFASLETLGDDAAGHARFRTRLRPGESRDHTALHLRATLVVSQATRTIASIELASVDAFSPTIGVKIADLKTLMTYSLPAGDTPSLPQTVSTEVHGRAFFFKSLDAEMTVTYSHYEYVGKK